MRHIGRAYRICAHYYNQLEREDITSMTVLNIEKRAINKLRNEVMEEMGYVSSSVPPMDKAEWRVWQEYLLDVLTDSDIMCTLRPPAKTKRNRNLNDG